MVYHNIENLCYISVRSFNAEGNGKHDDRPAIQKAFNSGQNIYFPKGKYLLKSKTATNAMLRISENKYPQNILFHKDAELIISPNQKTDYIKPAAILILAKKGTINSISISGLNIDGNRDKHNIQNPAIVAFERKGAKIKNLSLNNITIRNMGGGGIHTQARYNDFKNIYTENCGSHGIGIINTTNPGIVNEFYLDGYTSINDDAYSIDFSGYKTGKKAVEGYSWKGVAKNIVSKNSFYGIKTAGYWDLKLENVLIENSAHNGFFINVDAPGKTIRVTDMTIINAKGNGMSLSGKTNFIGKNIRIIGSGCGLKIGKTDVTIDSLLVDSQDKSTCTVRMGTSNVKLSNFIIKNSAPKDEYAIWVQGKNIVLKNGEFIDVKSPTEMIIHENAENVIIKNVKFGKGKNRRSKKAIVNIQKQGKTIVEESDFSSMRTDAVTDRSKRLIIKKKQ